MPSIKITPLGAGQDVGRSCIIVTIGDKRIMFDCGMHMGYSDARKYPDFSFLTKGGSLNDFIDVVLISHFHLDHCGSLPYMSEQVGYDGPILMSTPTKAIARILIEDMRKILAEKKTEDLFTTQMIKDSFNKVTEISLHQVININGIEIKAYYAGHVLGAVMFKVTVGGKSVVYTGDFNMTPDNHLGGAWIDRCEPDILITEATYATTIRESRRCRENDLLAKVHQVIDNGGKVLIPVFALGRAQEICLLLEKYWERKNLKIPIYMSTGMAEKAVNYYKLFISWTNQSIKDSQDERNLFHFKHVQPFDRSLVDTPGPMVVLASPGMLHAGLSCFIFKKWASDPANAIIMAGYCTVGTLGNRVLSGQKRLEIIEHGTSTVLDVNLQVMNMSFSAHADSIGIFQLIDFCRPKKAVILVHADAEVMKKFSPAVKSEYNLNCYCPENGQNLVVEVDPPPIKGLVPREMVSRFEAVSNQRFHGYVTIDSNAKYPIKVDSIKHNSSYKEIEFSMSFNMNIKKSQNFGSISIPDVINKINENIKLNHPSVFVDKKSENSFSVDSVYIDVSETSQSTRHSDISSFTFNLSWIIMDQDVVDSLITLIKYSVTQIST